ncbi:MAG: hypothetical protein ABIG39_01705 [Candidatus Micrarchaeota archaeon]
MEKTIVLLIILSLLFGCTGQEEAPEQDADNSTQKPPGTPTLSQLRGCVPGLSFTYAITEKLTSTSSKTLHRYTTVAGEQINGKETILKRIEVLDLAGDSSMTTFSREWDSADDCACLKRETVVQYNNQTLTIDESCPEALLYVPLPKITCVGEEQVSVLAYTGMANRYELSFENDDASYTYWVSEGIDIPVKSLYNLDEVEVLTELASYG